MTARRPSFREENALLRAACRLDANQPPRQTASSLDWNYLLASATYHRLSPLLRGQLATMDASQIPPSVHARVHHEYWSNHFRNRQLRQEIDRIAEAARDRGIALMALKGASLAWTQYPDPALRPMVDLDFVVDAGQLAVFGETLSGLGYARREIPDSYVDEARLHPASREYQWTMRRDDLAILVEYRARPLELTFWRLADLDSILSAEIDRHVRLLWARARPALTSASMLRLSVEDEILIVGAHLLKHSDFRLIWLCDLARLVAHAESIDLAYLCEQASRCRLTGPLLVALRAAAAWTGGRLPADLEATLTRSAEADRSLLVHWEIRHLERRFDRLGSTDLTVPGSPVRLLATGLARLRGARARTAALRWAIFPRGDVVQRWREPGESNRFYRYGAALGRRYRRGLSRWFSSPRL